MQLQEQQQQQHQQHQHQQQHQQQQQQQQAQQQITRRNVSTEKNNLRINLSTGTNNLRINLSTGTNKSGNKKNEPKKTLLNEFGSIIGNNNYNSNQFNNNINNNINNNNNKPKKSKTPCEEKMETLGVTSDNVPLPYMYMKFKESNNSNNSKKKTLEIFYHPRHSREKIATIEIKSQDENNKKDDEKDKLKVIINPLIGQYTMNYFIIMNVANLFWYSSQYTRNKKEYDKLFNTKKDTLKKFDKDVYIFDRFDKLRIIDDKMMLLLDNVFTKINVVNRQ